MIDLSKEKRTAETYVGKIVWLDGGMHYAKLTGAAFVDGLSRNGKSLVGRKLSRSRGPFVYDGVSDDSMDGVTMSTGWIAATCDTIAEANTVREANLAAKALYEDAIRQGASLIAALAGICVADEAATEHEGPKP